MASIPPCWRRVHRDLQEHAPALMALSKKRRAAALCAWQSTRSRPFYLIVYRAVEILPYDLDASCVHSPAALRALAPGTLFKRGETGSPRG
jgi:hypothetical protein